MADRFDLRADDSLFLLIDFQENLFNAMEKKVREIAERNVGLMVSSCNVLNVPILLTEQYSKGLGHTVERVRKKLGNAYKPVEKIEFSSYSNVDFQAAFQEIRREHIMVAGIEAHVCVLQSVLELLSEGHKVHVLRDATCSRYKNDWEAAMAYMSHAGATISTTEIAVFQLLRRAGTPEFKALSPLFKDKERYWSL